MSTYSEPRHHDDLLNYHLKRLVTLGGAPAIRLCEGQFGLTRSEWRVMAALVEEGPRSPSDLVVRVHLEPARTSRLVSALVAKRLVQRVQDPKDRRCATLAATPKACALYASLFPRLAEINRRIVEVLSEHEAVLLEGLLHRLTLRAQEIYDAGGGVEVKTDRWLGSGHRPRA